MQFSPNAKGCPTKTRNISIYKLLCLRQALSCRQLLTSKTSDYIFRFNSPAVMLLSFLIYLNLIYLNLI